MKKENIAKMIGAILGVMFLSFTAHAGVIKVGDVLDLSLRGVPHAEQQKVNSMLRVRDSGKVKIPIINVEISAAGRKPEDVEKSIEAAYKNAEIYRAPTISIQVHEKKKDEEVIQKVVVVGGEVRRPGRVQYRQGMTLMEALQQAGGRGTFASKYLFLTRKHAASGELRRYKYNYKDAKTQALKVYPNDVINVPVRGPGWKDNG